MKKIKKVITFFSTAFRLFYLVKALNRANVQSFAIKLTFTKDMTVNPKTSVTFFFFIFP